ncbi:hypothetical protein C1886_24495 [Pseudomonas sp. FW300-N1A1]|uniref:hypothetical protein n=1 Tax=Pseudomonas sp. FW300-N1A1 TaxID=2075555 RepID=UPI000CD04283|nr:hypothetical protein [Pseudomonas sp. FW300-N1A1]POA16958.1 hypothetical protein C1886_24495 [Pseudomonas sp. FW300-N1A1]
MLDQSFIGLCERMQGKSVTRGWDAIVTMNRTKVNALLEQQYISRLKRDSFLKKIFGEVKITPNGYAMLDFTGLVLSQPRLSFENATLSNSRARLTMEVESGTVSQRVNVPGWPSRVTESFNVTPQHGFKVYADIDLFASSGTVEEQGRVILDLGNAVNFSSNLVDEALAQEALGAFFARLYRALPAEDRVYELGTLDFNDDDLLVPREFAIRTQMAPGGNDVLSDSYLDGAVVLFIRTRNNPTNGSLPVDGSNFPYLIPDDRDPQTGVAIYSGSLVLASRVLFDWFVEPYLMSTIGHNLRFQRESLSNDVARSLRAVAGGFPVDDVYYEWDEGAWNSGKGYVKNTLPLSVLFASDQPESAFRVFSASGILAYEWVVDKPIQFYIYEDVLFPGWLPWEEVVDGATMPRIRVKIKAVISAVDNVVVFGTQVGSQFDVFDNIEARLIPYVSYAYVVRIQNLLGPVRSSIRETFKGLEAPAINIFHLNHLLFPEQNALLLTEAALPGDLFLVGHIDPKHTAFTLEPLFARVKVGTSLQFEVKQLTLRAIPMTWSARNIDGEQVPGVINQNGLFTAPDLSLIKGLAERYVVTASYTGDDGLLREASAMVAVVVESLNVTPSIATLEFSDAKPVRFRAANLGAGPLRWTLREPFGTLQPNGDEALYTLPDTPGEQAGGLVVIDVEDLSSGEKTSACILWLRRTFALPVDPGFHPGLPAGAVTQLRVADRDIDPYDLVWEVLAGDGQVDPETGLFTAPDTIESPYSVVQATYGRGTLAHRGYAIIHLSNFARASDWTELSWIKLTSSSNSLSLYGNGLQQVNVTVSVQPKEVGGKPVNVSEEELASIELLRKDENGKWLPLDRVGPSGVPEGGGWAYNLEANDYEPYPVVTGNLQAADGAVPHERSALFYVQSRAVGTLEIAASLRGDNGITYLSNGVGDPSMPERTITLRCEEPTDFSSSVYTLIPKRMAGTDEGFNPEFENDGNDKDLTTVDYYLLRLELDRVIIPIQKVEFLAAKSMVQWESRQFAEDVCSFTGYAYAGSRELHFDPLLYARMPESIRPDKEIDRSFVIPSGQFMLSLHRCEYWAFDLNCEPDYTTGLDLIIHDHYGNRHRVKIHFKDANSRNSLRTVKY